MALEMLKAEIALLISKLADDPQDTRELEVQLHEKLNEMRAYGMPLPQDLVDLEATLLAKQGEQVTDGDNDNQAPADDPGEPNPRQD